jgi:light-regulated signal transduction histidine kinase (bacteriophytochrome)
MANAVGPSADLDECAREPIHIPGSIQPHGYLFVVDAADLTVAAVSQNAADAMGLPTTALIGCRIAELLVPAPTGDIDVSLRSKSGTTPLRVRFRRSETSATWDCLIHPADALILLELVPRIGSQRAELVLGEIRPAIERIRQAQSPETVCESLAREIRWLTGFDRVMIYRFDPDWNGEVIAEDKAAGAHSYLGHAFPAADIPAQARALYLRNTIRLIPDASYTPSPIVPSSLPSTGRPVDLSAASLRSVSPVHLEYLANMGVAASMSVSILRGGRLWGLVACHHPTPRMVPDAVLQICGFLAQEVAWYLDTHDRSAVAACFETARRIEAEYTSRTGAEPDYPGDLTSIAPALLDVTRSEGCAICDGRSIWTAGLVPSDEQVLALASWLSATGDERLTTSHLPELYPPADEYRGVASGIAARKLPEGWLIWFRVEWPYTIIWAGDVHEAIRAHSGSGRINPRKSFASWRQSIHGESRAWTARDHSAVDEGHAIILRASMRDQVRRRQALEKRICEAERMAAIGQVAAGVAHEFNNLLAVGYGNLELLAKRLDHDPGATELVSDMTAAVLHGTELTSRLLAYSQLQQLAPKDIDVGTLLARQAGALRAAIAESVVFHWSVAPGLWSCRIDPRHLENALLNLVRNANDAMQDGGVLTIAAENAVLDEAQCRDQPDVVAGRYVVLSVRDTGAGMTKEVRDRAIEPFFTGKPFGVRTGLGLSMVHGFLKQSGGHLTIDSEPGRGTVVKLYLPAYGGVAEP